MCSSDLATTTYNKINGEEHESTLEMKLTTAATHFKMGNHSDAKYILKSIRPASEFGLGREHRLTNDICGILAQIDEAGGWGWGWLGKLRG